MELKLVYNLKRKFVKQTGDLLCRFCAKLKAEFHPKVEFSLICLLSPSSATIGTFQGERGTGYLSLIGILFERPGRGP